MRVGCQSDTMSRLDAIGCCQVTVDYHGGSGHGNRCQDAGDAGDAKTMSLTSGHNAYASDTGFIFADETPPFTTENRDLI